MARFRPLQGGCFVIPAFLRKRERWSAEHLCRRSAGSRDRWGPWLRQPTLETWTHSLTCIIARSQGNTAFLITVRIQCSSSRSAFSAVDPDPVGSGTFSSGRKRIQDNFYRIRSWTRTETDYVVYVLPSKLIWVITRILWLNWNFQFGRGWGVIVETDCLNTNDALRWKRNRILCLNSYWYRVRYRTKHICYP